MNLIGPISQILTMDKLPLTGPIRDDQMEIITHGGILYRDDIIEKVGDYEELLEEADQVLELPHPCVALPGLIDSHTHLCFAGTRTNDYTLRMQGKSYQEGGGILETVEATREAAEHQLRATLSARLESQAMLGITTCEVKSGYGLTVADELKMLNAINAPHCIDVIPTCLAAHVRPPEFSSNQEYLDTLLTELLPQVLEQGLSKRLDIFVEEGAFTPSEAESYLMRGKEMGFDLTVHANQFSEGGAALAANVQAMSADHLEVMPDCSPLKKNSVSAIVLPGASLGLGIPFAPARKMLDEGLSVAIASDWNPGSAPMGHLLCQAALLSIYEKLSHAEVYAGLTFRAARALNLADRGTLSSGHRADIALFPCQDFRDILYQQGMLTPNLVFQNGHSILNEEIYL